PRLEIGYNSSHSPYPFARSVARSVDRTDDDWYRLAVPDPAVVHDVDQRSPLRVTFVHRYVHGESQHGARARRDAEALRPRPEHLPAAERGDQLGLAAQFRGQPAGHADLQLSLAPRGEPQAGGEHRHLRLGRAR